MPGRYAAGGTAARCRPRAADYRAPQRRIRPPRAHTACNGDARDSAGSRIKRARPWFGPAHAPRCAALPRRCCARSGPVCLPWTHALDAQRHAARQHALRHLVIPLTPAPPAPPDPGADADSCDDSQQLPGGGGMQGDGGADGVSTGFRSGVQYASPGALRSVGFASLHALQSQVRPAAHSHPCFPAAQRRALPPVPRGRQAGSPRQP